VLAVLCFCGHCARRKKIAVKATDPCTASAGSAVLQVHKRGSWWSPSPAAPQTLEFFLHFFDALLELLHLVLQTLQFAVQFILEVLFLESPLQLQIAALKRLQLFA